MRAAARARARARARGDSGERGRETCAPPLSLSSARARLPVGPMSLGLPRRRPSPWPGLSSRRARRGGGGGGWGSKGGAMGGERAGRGGPRSARHRQRFFFFSVLSTGARAPLRPPTAARFLAPERGDTRAAPPCPGRERPTVPASFPPAPPNTQTHPVHLPQRKKKKHARVRLRTQASERPRHARSGTGGGGGYYLPRRRPSGARRRRGRHTHGGCGRRCVSVARAGQAAIMEMEVVLVSSTEWGRRAMHSFFFPRRGAPPPSLSLPPHARVEWGPVEHTPHRRTSLCP